MKKYRDILFYVVVLFGFTGVIYLIIREGSEHDHPVRIEPNRAPGEDNMWSAFTGNLHHPLAILLLQIITIIFAARIFGYFCKKIKQPTVVGEIAAGIFLGPSFIGTWTPGFSGFLFPDQSLSNLQFLSQIGLILFMFVIGMELDLKVLKNRARDAVIISHASIIVPFTLGIGLAYYLYDGFAPPGINFLSFALFTGIAMSITAFPVLARIVQEKGLSKTKLGTIAITCAAADDITAWCLLAAVIAIVKAGSALSAGGVILMASVYVVFMLGLVRPFLKRIGDKYANREALSKPVVAIFFITLLASSYSAEVIGVHALFGAFMAGVIMPANVRFRNLFIEKVEDVSVVFLLPLFFVFTGLRTEIGLLDTAGLWTVCALIILVAVAGKFLGSALASRFVGQSWRDSLIIGALMNTRGLMELVVLNIGYDLGVLTPEIFAMMVIMALVTTFMTAPALYITNRYFSGKLTHGQAPLASAEKNFNVLVSFGSPDRGISLLRVAHALVSESPEHTSVTAMHLSPSNEINQYNFIEFEKESFRPIKQEAKKLKIAVNLYFKPSQDIEGEIVETANQGQFSLLLIGIGRSVFEGTYLGRFFDLSGRILNPGRVLRAARGKEKLFEQNFFDEKVKYISRTAQVPVGILVDQKTETINRILLLNYTPDDQVCFEFARRFANNPSVSVAITGEPELRGSGTTSGLQGQALQDLFPGRVEFVAASQKIEKRYLSGFDLLLVSVQGWKKIVASRPKWLDKTPSVLIIKAQA